MSAADAAESVLFGVQVAALPVLALASATLLVTLGPVYWRQRQRSAIRTRNPLWTLFCLVLLAVMLLNYAYDGWHRYPSCAKILFTNTVLAPLVVDVYVIRCWMLLYRWKVSRALCEIQSSAVLIRPINEGGRSSPHSAMNENAWLRHMRWGGTARLRWILLGAAVVHLCWWIGLVETWSDWRAGPAESAICTPSFVWIVGVWSQIEFGITFAVVLAYNMRLLVDVFAIRTELMRTGLVFVVVATPLWAVCILNPSFERIRTLSIMLPISVNLCGSYVLYISLVQPLLIASRDLRRVAPAVSGIQSGITVTGLISGSLDGDNGDDVLDEDNVTELEPVTVVRRVGLRYMLDTMTGISGDFIRFLTKEFSVENWGFYAEVNRLRRQYGAWRSRDSGRSGLESGSLDWFQGLSSASSDELRDELSRIFALYVAANAPFEINLNSAMLESIRVCFGPDSRLRAERQEYLPMLLCRAQDQIYNLIKTDSYERFKHSADFDPNQLALV